MPWTYQSTGTVVTSGSGALLSPGAPAGVVAGNLLLLYTGQRTSGAVGPAVSAGFDLIGSLGYGAAALDIWARIADGTVADTPTVDWDGTNWSFAWLERRDGGTYTTLASIVAHVATDTGNNSTGLRLPAFTPATVADCTVIGFASKNNTAIDATLISHASLTKRTQSIATGASRLHAACGDLQQTTATDYDGTDFTIDGTSENLGSRGIILYLRTSSAAVTISDVATGRDIYDGMGISIEGENFGATQGASTVKLKTADGSPSVTQTPTLWSATSIELVVESTALPFGAINVEVVVGASTVTFPVTLVSALGYANGVANVPWSVGAGSIFDGASPAVVDGDLYEYETLSDQGATVEVFTDGTFVVGSGVGTHKFDARVYDQTDETWSAFVEQTIAAEESTYETVYGRATSDTGVLQTIVLADDVEVPGATTLKNGVALSVNGYVYVCPWPATMAVGYVGGVAVRFDGALIVKDESTITTKYYANGIPVSFRGEVSVSLSAPTGIKNGIGRVGDAICVSDF